MSKYDELCDAMEKQSMEMTSLRGSCVQFGQKLAKNLAAYLECPAEGMWYRTLDRNFAAGDRIWQVEDRGFPAAEIRRGDDGFWYFAVEICLKSGYIIDRFGIKRSNNKYLVRNSETIHEIGINEEREFNSFFSWWYDSILKAQSSAADKPTSRIGFHSDNKDRN